jgi:hypothetical protein
MTSVPAEIRTESLPNTSLIVYCMKCARNFFPPNFTNFTRQSSKITWTYVMPCETAPSYLFQWQCSLAIHVLDSTYFFTLVILHILKYLTVFLFIFTALLISGLCWTKVVLRIKQWFILSEAPLCSFALRSAYNVSFSLNIWPTVVPLRARNLKPWALSVVKLLYI